jgi:hypothetical protein
MASLIVHPDNKEQLIAIKAVMKALKIPFEVKKSPYDLEFVKMIKQGQKEFKAGKGVKVDLDALWE